MPPYDATFKGPKGNEDMPTNFKKCIPSSTGEETSTFVSRKLKPCGCRR